jgi:vacuolar protein-sorting-associated protein 4
LGLGRFWDFGLALLLSLPCCRHNDPHSQTNPTQHTGVYIHTVHNQQHPTIIMENQMINQGIEIVQKAIAADGEGDYEKALGYYRDALSRFTTGLKYEKNPTRKALILERTQGYMNRAEELADYVKKQSELDKGGGGGTASKNKGDADEPDDAEKKKLRGALTAAILTEKPNVKWDDVAGLESAKESLKEVC